MTEIITQNETVEIKKRIRSPNIQIINPEVGNKSIIFRLSEATYYNGVFQGEKSLDNIIKELDMPAMLEDVTFVDPISQQQVTLKVATVAKAVESYFIKLYNQRN